MKGFIEVHRADGSTLLIAVDAIDFVLTDIDDKGTAIWLRSDADQPIDSAESYDQVKRLIEQAQEG